MSGCGDPVHGKILADGLDVSSPRSTSARLKYGVHVGPERQYLVTTRSVLE